MLITVSGPPGSGKSTTASKLAEALGLEHKSGGDIFRELAAERGYSTLEFNKLAEEDDQIDRDLDRRLAAIAAEEDDLVLESRLAGWLAGDDADFRVWLDAPLDVRAERIAEREEKPVANAREETAARESSETDRYREYYGIDITNLKIYDLSINTARWDAEAVLDMLVTAVEEYDAGVDEGLSFVAVEVVALDGGDEHVEDGVGLPAGRVHREVVDRQIPNVDPVVLLVPLGLAGLAGFRFLRRAGRILLLAVGDAFAANPDRRVQPEPKVRLLARQPAGESGLEHQPVLLDRDLSQSPIEIAVDRVVFLGEFVELEGGVAAFVGQFPEDVTAADVVEIEGVSEQLGGRALSAARRAGDGE